MHSYGAMLLGISAFVGLLSVGLTQTYADTMALFNDKMNSSVYSIDVRPIHNQSRVLRVNVSFSLLTIVDVDDVSQSFHCNGLIKFVWRDEMLAWDPDEYGGQTMIHPQAKDIWRPRVILSNTLEDRDIFADDNAPILLTYDGVVRWYPGSTFKSACALNMIKYPFDTQICFIELIAMSYTLNELQFVPGAQPVYTEFYVASGEWVLQNATLTLHNNTNFDGFNLGALVIAFSIKRNPTLIFVNIILPVVLLSFLNLWVFVIPVKSGEKIGFGTTVLTSLSVFMTTMGTMLPAISDKLPLVVSYLMLLFFISILTVITSIVIMFLHHKEENVAHHNRAKTNLNRITNKVTMLKGATTALENADLNITNPNKVQTFTPQMGNSDPLPGLVKDGKPVSDLHPRPNRYKTIGKYIDMVSLIIFFGAWLFITLGFLLALAS
ncbi:hypothetical protein BsWGS_07233 [Bradybaena similaris]